MTAIDALSGNIRKPASGGTATSAVVFLHGYGASGDDLIGLAPYFAESLPDTIFYAPHAPSPVEGGFGGYQWFSLRYYNPDMLRANGSIPAQFLDMVAGEFAEAASKLDTFLDQVLAHNDLAPERLVLVGFSQGTMMSLHAGPRRTRKIGGIVGFSGALIWPEKLPVEIKTKPPTALIHGSDDQVVPVTATEHAAKALSAAGVDCRVKIVPRLQHGIDDSGAAFAAEFLATVLR